MINKCAKNKKHISFPTYFLIGNKHVSDPNIIANEFNDVLQIILNLKSRSRTGYDMISNKHIKLGDVIINLVLSGGTFPDSLHKMIKREDLKQLSNYRPTSFLTSVSIFWSRWFMIFSMTIRYYLKDNSDLDTVTPLNYPVFYYSQTWFIWN